MSFMESSEILNQIYIAHKFLQKLETEPRNYGTGDILYPTDIHTIVAIYENPGCSLTSLAQKLTVSKAAVSKFTKKLCSLNYIIKNESLNHGKMVQFYLSEKGSLAVQSHKKFEKKAFGPLRKVIDNRTENEQEIILSFLSDLIEAT